MIVYCSFYLFAVGCARTVQDTVLVDLVGADKAATGEGWALTMSGALDLLVLPCTGKML